MNIIKKASETESGAYEFWNGRSTMYYFGKSPITWQTAASSVHKFEVDG